MAWLRDGFLKAFGKVKVFPWPFWMVYDPGSYKLKGHDARALIDLARPGDVLVRGFDNYLDGKFIPGYFSHAAIFLGPTRDEDLGLVRPGARRLFRVGAQTVIHAIAEGVLMEDLLDFCRCDRLLLLRFPSRMRATPGAPPLHAVSLKSGLEKDERPLLERLEEGGEVGFEEAWPVIRRQAIQQLGRGYDFGFDFTDVRRLCCTELVHRATRCLAPFLAVQPIPTRILFLRGTGIAPDAFAASPLDLAWASPSVDPKRLAGLRERALVRAVGDAVAA
jgi:hypothetical protein